MAARARVVGINDLIKVIECLEKNGFPEDQWFGLGLKLGIIYVKLKEIEANNPSDAKACLRECVILWLKWNFDIDQYGKPTMESLAAAVRGMGQKAVAEGILHNFDEDLFSSSERMAESSASSDVLYIKDLNMLMIVLEDNHFPNNQWNDLGLRLGIIQLELETIRVVKQDSKGCLLECLVRWLQQDYDTARYSLPTMESLVAALRRMGLKAVAKGITLHTQDYYGLPSYCNEANQDIKLETGHKLHLLD